jgi:agmatine deiminase
MIPDWQTDFVSFSDLLPARHPALWEKLLRILDRGGIGCRLLPHTRDIWVRDFMPVQVAAEDFVLFRYRPDYLQGHDHLITPDTIRAMATPGGRLRSCAINLDGGNVVGSDNRAILTDKVLKENPGRDRRQVRAELDEILRVNHCIIIPKEPYDVIGHADGVVRFLDEGAVLVNDYSEVNPAYGERLEAVLRRHGLAVERLPHFRVNEEHDGIPSAVGHYVNFLCIARLVVVPAFGVPQDDLACRRLEELLPKARVVPLRCEGLAREGGALNCVAWTVLRGSVRPGSPHTRHAGPGRETPPGK